jgi:thymidylate synthase ThyX
MEIDVMRRIMGTMPDRNVRLKTEFFEGVEGIKVKLIDFPKNPYKAIYTMATSTWGKHIDKWDETPIDGRIAVVKSVLDFKSLPNAMESFSFTFAVEGCSRSAFDQIARSRIGFVFASMGWRDNDHSDIGFRVPMSIVESDYYDAFKESVIKNKEFYHDLVSKGQANWQDARSIIPISACHNFSFAANYMALRSFESKRLKFCEQADTVAVAWLIREEMLKKFPLLGMYLRPSCDFKRKCEYHQAYDMSEMFGCLFKECGRNPYNYANDDSYATFNTSCTNKFQLERQLNIKIPNAIEDMPINYNNMSTLDMDLFVE